MITYSFTAKSGNEKLGAIATTMASKQSCPPNCPLKGKGCYGEFHLINYQWNTKCVLSFDALCVKIDALKAGSVLRLNSVGDLPGENNQLDANQINLLDNACESKRAYTYTHYPVTQHNIDILKGLKNIVVNLSADHINQVDEYMKLGLPVAVILPSTTTSKTVKTPGGNTVVVCPAILNDNTTCKKCMICSKKNRSFAVGFPAHGSRKTKINAVLAKNS